MTETKRNDTKVRAYLVSFWVNFSLPPLKLVVGTLGHSPALIADGINSLADVISNVMVYIFLKLSGKPRDKDHSYGHGKYEIVATFIIAALMIVSAAFIIADNVRTIIRYFTKGDLPLQPDHSVLLVAALAVGLKIFAFLYTEKKAKQTKSSALHAEALNHKGDIFSSSVVLTVAALSIWLGGIAQLLEPVGAIIVAVLIIKMGVEVWRPSLSRLTDGTVSPEVQEKIIATAAQVPNVYDPHNLRTRMIGSDSMAIEMDIRVDGNKSLHEAHELSHHVKDALIAEFGAGHHIIIHQEPLLPEGEDGTNDPTDE